ncbi:Protein of unknown function [Gryllus bimaculatus]|nr:Protein of unknown function [Gryllus bimaculatus]
MEPRTFEAANKSESAGMEPSRDGRTPAEMLHCRQPRTLLTLLRHTGESVYNTMRLVLLVTALVTALSSARSRELPASGRLCSAVSWAEHVTWTSHKRLGSSSFIVVYVLEERSRGGGQAEFAAKAKNEMYYGLRSSLWLIHQSYKWLLVGEVGQLQPGSWSGLQKPYVVLSTAPPDCLGLVCYYRKMALRAGSIQFHSPENISKSDRIEFCLVAGLIEFTPHHGRLYTLTTHPEFFEEIDTFKQLVESNMTIYGINADYLTYFLSANLHADILEDGLYRQKAVEMTTKKINSTDEAANLFKGNTRFALVDDNTDNRLKYRQALSSIWNNIHEMRAQILPTMKSNVLRRKWPFKEKMERIYGRLVDVGIVLHWKDVYLREIGTRMDMEMWRNVTEDAPPTDDPLRFGPEDVQVHFLLLGVGLLLSAAALAVEAALGWRRGSGRGRTLRM